MKNTILPQCATQFKGGMVEEPEMEDFLRYRQYKEKVEHILQEE